MVRVVMRFVRRALNLVDESVELREARERIAELEQQLEEAMLLNNVEREAWAWLRAERGRR